jgi:hypothetical protein
MRIDSSGNLLLGDTSTAGNAKFYLRNGSSGQSYSNVSGMLIDVNGTSNSYYGLRVGSSTGNSHLAVTNAGNVGIGTSSPSEKLTVEGDGTFKNTTDATGATLKVADNVNRAITITSPIAAGSAAGRIAVTGTSNSLEIGVRDYPTALKIEGGSGNALFSSSVTVSKTSSGNIMQVASLVNPVGVANTGVRLWMSGKNTTDRGTFIDAVAESTLNNHSLRFGTSASASFPVEAMRIDSSGNLLVGTTDTSLYNNGAGGNTGVVVEPSGTIQLAKSNNICAYLNRLDSDGAILDFRKDGSAVGSIGTVAGYLGIANGDTGLLFRAPYDDILPYSSTANSAIDDTIDLGDASFRFQDIYATNGTIQTSDRNEKQDIEALTDAETRVAVAAKGLLRKFRWQSAVEEKGDDARIHFGIIAQDLQDAFTAEGLDAGDYAMFISSTWTNDDGVEQTRLGVRYNELLAFIIAAI